MTKLRITAGIEGSPITAGFDVEIPDKYGRVITSSVEMLDAIRKGVETIHEELKDAGD